MRRSIARRRRARADEPVCMVVVIDGARGEAARLAMVIGRVPFEDDRVKFADWPARKPGTPFGALPVLEVDGQGGRTH